MKRIAFVLALSLMVVACAGTPFKWDEARRIQPGMTTKDVTDLLGPPYLATSAGDKLIYVWSYATAFGGAKALSIEFKDNKVVKVPPIPDTY